MILKTVQNFDDFPDGRLRAGPFRGTPAELSVRLDRYGICLDTENSAGICSRNIQGMMISCAGQSVMGYLMDEDGLEISSTDLEDFLEASVMAGTIFTIEGHHCPDEDTMIKSTLSAWWSGQDLFITSQRVLESRGGARQVIHSLPPNAARKSPERSSQRLCLVSSA